MDVGDDEFRKNHGLVKNLTYLASQLLLVVLESVESLVVVAVESFVLVHIVDFALSVESFVDSSVVVEVAVDVAVEALHMTVEIDTLSSVVYMVVDTVSVVVGNQFAGFGMAQQKVVVGYEVPCGDEDSPSGYDIVSRSSSISQAVVDRLSVGWQNIVYPP